MQEIADMRQALEVLARRSPSFMLRLAASVSPGPRLLPAEKSAASAERAVA